MTFKKEVGTGIGCLFMALAIAVLLNAGRILDIVEKAIQ